MNDKLEEIIEKIHDKINDAAEKRIKDIEDEWNGLKEEEKKEELLKVKKKSKKSVQIQL